MADKKFSDFTSTPIPDQTDLVAGVNAAGNDNLKIPVSAFATGAEGDLATTAVQVVSGTAPVVSTPSGTTRTISMAAATAAVDGYMTATAFSRLENTSGTNTGDSAVNSTSNTYADAKVADAINNGTTTIAPSQNAVFDALALKAPLLSPSFTTPSLGDATALSINGGTLTGNNSGDNATNTSAQSYADAKVADAINNGTTTIAPSQNAVFDALALKENGLGNPGTDGHVLASTTGGVRSWVAPGGAGGSAHIIADDGVAKTDRATLNFIEDFDVVDNNPTTDVKLNVANKASLDLADTALQTESPNDGLAYLRTNTSGTEGWVRPTHADLGDVENDNAHPIGAITGLSTQLTAIAQWEADHLAAENPHNMATNEEYLIVTGAPTGLPGVVPQKAHDTQTGDIYRYVGGAGGGSAGYVFNGTRTATLLNDWESLGDNTVYADVQYQGNAGLVPTLPIDYSLGTGYSGTVSNLYLTDSAPIQGVTVCYGNNARYFDLDQYIELTGTFDISFNWIREDAVSTQTTVMGNMDSLTTSSIHLTNAATNDIILEIGAGTITFSDVLVGKDVGKQVAIRIYRDEDDLISCEVDGFPAGTAQTLAGTLTINSFGKGATNQLLNTDSALHGVEITDSSGRLWDFPLDEGTGTTIGNYDIVTNKLAWFTNSQIYSNNIEDGISPPPPPERVGIFYSSGGEKGGPASNTVVLSGIDTGYYTTNNNADPEDVWKFSWTPTTAEYAKSNLIRLATDATYCSSTHAGTRASDGGAFYALSGSYVHRSFWDNSWTPVGTLNDKKRSEMNTPNGYFIPYNQEIWIGFAVWVPNTAVMIAQCEGFSNTSGNNFICQLHPGDPGPFNGIKIVNDQWHLSYGDYSYGTNAFCGAVEKGKWTKFVIHTNMSTGSDNYCDIWIDQTSGDTPIFRKSGIGYPINDSGHMNFKFGVYVGATFSSHVCYFYDEFRFGDSTSNFNSVLPGGV